MLIQKSGTVQCGLKKQPFKYCRVAIEVEQCSIWAYRVTFTMRLVVFQGWVTQMMNSPGPSPQTPSELFTEVWGTYSYDALRWRNRTWGKAALFNHPGRLSSWQTQGEVSTSSFVQRYEFWIIPNHVRRTVPFTMVNYPLIPPEYQSALLPLLILSVT